MRHSENPRLQDALVTGAPTSEDDMKAIAEALFKWSRELGAVSFAHWFFPMRGGSGAVGGQVVPRFELVIGLPRRCVRRGLHEGTVLHSNRLLMRLTRHSEAQTSYTVRGCKHEVHLYAYTSVAH